MATSRDTVARDEIVISMVTDDDAPRTVWFGRGRRSAGARLLHVFPAWTQ